MEGRKPVRKAIVKKRTGPLFSEDILSELSSKPAVSAPQTSASHTTSRRTPSIKEKKEKKRERWLLTRKTWKYMADAGRKLIPDGVQNRPEDIQKCERHFQNLCANEPKFVLWRRKASYPGAMGATRNSKRRLKLLLTHSHKSINTEEETEESRNADQIIDLLQNYLKLDESRKTTTLLGAKTVRPDQTASPSAQRPGSSSRGIGSQSMAMSSRGPGFLPPLAQPLKGINALSEIDQLLERLRTLSRSASCRTIIPLERITPEILEDKALLKQIYNELKKQQLHRIIGKYSSTTTNNGQRTTLPHASSLSSLWNFRRDGSTKGSFSGKSPSTFISFGGLRAPNISASSPPLSPSHEQTKRHPPSSLDLSDSLSYPLKPPQSPPMISIKKPSVEVAYATSGTQTSFIQLNEIERLAKDYKDLKREEAAMQAAGSGGQPTDDESDKGATAGHGHRRKSSIDNEDVSQSVSDTIKRYLRMARKKSVHDDNANRFKRVNYDRNLRNIRAKGEINPPGMDEGNSKATQTLDAWPVISLDFIRGNDSSILEEAHIEWRKNLDQRIQNKHEYEEKLKQQQQETAAKTGTSSQHPTHSSSSSSAPTSPTNPVQSHGHGSIVPTASGILHSSTQFLSNLWHGTGHHQHLGQENSSGYHPLQGSKTNSTNSIMSAGSTASGHFYNSKNDSAAMQKSKSSSNVGQFVSKKIWKTRSKSQTRTSSPTKAEWTPRGNCTWTSDSGRQITLNDAHLQSLTEVEAKILQRVAIEKINQLNIGVSVAVPCDADSTAKSQKRRPLAKKKAMTTSFFDIGRKDDKGSHIGVFGNTLENCVAHDQKRQTNLGAASDRGSRNSITSLFRGSASSKVRSCESLPSGSYNLPHSESTSSSITAGSGDYEGSRGSGNGNLVRSAAMQISRSQSDIRRTSQDYDDMQINNSMIAPPPMTDPSSEVTERQVPAFVRECIKHLEEHGLNLVGIFRVSTSKKRVRQMREEFDRSANTVIDAEACPHDVATLLKEFLRDLPEPLLCRNLYKAFINTQKIRNRRLQLEALSHLVQLLPTAHRDTLYVLLRFLAKVASCCDDVVSPDGTVHTTGNKMDSNNLATVFAPNILRSSLPGEENSEQESMGDVINVIRTMIDHYEELFRVPAELMDEIYANMIDTFPEQLNYLCERRNIYENDEVDSGGSNTPLHSPPPIGYSKTGSDGILKRTQTNFSSEPSSEVRTQSESSSTSQAPVNPRRIYTREDVMHENAVSKGDPPQDSSNVSRRRTSKSKYSESDFPAHQQHKTKIGHNSDSLNTPTKPSTNVDFHSMHQQQPKVSGAITAAGTVSARRLSSPYVLDRTGVVTASLKIPVQMQAAAGSNNGTGYNARDTDDDEVFYRGSGQFDLSNIPYIEDSSYGNELGNCNEGFPITGSLSFGGGVGGGSGTDVSKARKSSIPSKKSDNLLGGATVYQIPITFEGQQITPQGEVDSKLKLASFLPSPNARTSPPGSNLPSKSKEKPTRKAPMINNSQQKSISKTKTTHLRTGCEPSPDNENEFEPKLTASISNIGGAILRSKTADFERMSNLAPAPVATPRRARTASNNTSDATASPRGLLYKRQELISSAKRTSK